MQSQAEYTETEGLPSTSILRGVNDRTFGYALGCATSTTPKERRGGGGCMVSEPTLDLVTSLPGDFNVNLFRMQSQVFAVGNLAPTCCDPAFDDARLAA